MNEKAFLFYSSSLTVHFIKKWKENRKETWKDLYFKRHVLPISHWKNRLLSIHLKSWRNLIKEKKELQKLESDAFKKRKDHLILNGLSAWIQVYILLIKSKI